MTDSISTLRLLAKCGSMDLSALGPIADEMERMQAEVLTLRQANISLAMRDAVEPNPAPKDYAEIVLRVEIASDTLHKVEEFTKFLANVILETPSDAGADVMVTIHREGELPVFETNRTPSEKSGGGQ